jgi:hypothetical protein
VTCGLISAILKARSNFSIQLRPKFTIPHPWVHIPHPEAPTELDTRLCKLTMVPPQRETLGSWRDPEIRDLAPWILILCLDLSQGTTQCPPNTAVLGCQLESYHLLSSSARYRCLFEKRPHHPSLTIHSSHPAAGLCTQ